MRSSIFFIFLGVVAATVLSFVAGMSYDAGVTTDDELRQTLLDLGNDVHKHDLHLDSDLIMYLVNIDTRTVDMLTIYPNDAGPDGHSSGHSQAGNVSATWKAFPNGTRTYMSMDETGTILKQIVIHDDPGYRLEVFMVDEGN